MGLQEPLEIAERCRPIELGDDLADLPMLRADGLAACPSDAAAEGKDSAHLITRARRRGHLESPGNVDRAGRLYVCRV